MKRVVIAGLGTVGGGVYTILTQQKERLARELGEEIRVEAVLVRDKAKRRILDVPAELIDRPKMGFSVPLGGWLRGELNDWARELIAPERLRREVFL